MQNNQMDDSEFIKKLNQANQSTPSFGYIATSMLKDEIGLGKTIRPTQTEKNRELNKMNQDHLNDAIYQGMG